MLENLCDDKVGIDMLDTSDEIVGIDDSNVVTSLGVVFFPSVSVKVTTSAFVVLVDSSFTEAVLIVGTFFSSVSIRISFVINYSFCYYIQHAS